ncbi:hypothetical protein FPOA_03689 [Fusarium poae]|uniref:TNFR-Cys domain-containing protein n=1 Tax=Fusarium poae TaxID=36050 RepID=A0A1B8AS06_FUSPO|nr:hypothetical protein FPOA_03689 [Fusarium poae]
MFKFLPVLLFAIVGIVFAEKYDNPGYGDYGNNQCAKWCAANFRHPGKTCTAPAAKRKGPCYDCGPKSTNRAKKLCYGVCKDTQSDSANCGKCGKSCPTKTHCVKGKCVCENSNQPQCKGLCPDYTTDSGNCGKCGVACKKDVEKCEGGKCVPTCPAGSSQCGSSCVDLKTDPNNCGTCGTTCPSGECENGACVAPGCAGQTCDTFTACGPGGSCVCASVAGGRGFCADGQTPCAGLADCNSTGDCPSGQVCIVGSCCTRNVCISADTCTNTASKMILKKVSGDTVGSRGGSK